FYLESGGMGLLAGLFAGFFGVGGGVVFVPTGVLLGGLPQHIAQGSSFTAILPTTIMGAIVYWKNGEISRKLLKWLIPGALVGAAAGSYIAALIPSNWLRIIFAIYLLYTGAGSFLPATRRKKTD
ncbi:MAG TPA: sulfite exporter TauE/SafE family protein, partial [bacterium]